MSRRTDTRAVSVTVNYAVSLGITAILISLLLLSAGNLLESQRERAAREQLQNVGAKVAQEVNYVDELDTNLNGTANATVNAALPDDISGLPYTVDIKPHQFEDSIETEAMLYLNTTATPEVSVKIPLGNETAVVPADSTATTSIQTDEIEITLCRGSGSAYPDSGQLIIFGGHCP